MVKPVLKIHVDFARCAGHARCTARAPDVYELDDNGYCVSDGKTVPPGLEAQAQLGAAACPERCISLTAVEDDSRVVSCGRDDTSITMDTRVVRRLPVTGEQSSLEERVQTLLDIEAIKSLKATYGQRADGLFDKLPAPEALAQLGELFSADAFAQFVGISEPLLGREAIIRYFSEELGGRVASMWHSFHNPRIEVDGDRARGWWTVYVVMKTKGPESQAPAVYFGRYEDTYVRTEAGWRQSRLIFRDESHRG